MIDLFEVYKFAAEEIKKFYLEQLLSSLEDNSLPEDFKEFVRKKGLSTEDVAKVFNSSPRQLMDVFDSNGIFIQISVLNEQFSYKILPRDIDFEDVEWYETRKEAEKFAVTDAIKLLNDKLCLQTPS